MSEVLRLTGSLVVFAGSVFLFLGGLGLLRMPDIYNRLQAGTKATTLGSMFVLVGLGIYNTEFISRLVILLIFIIVTNPVSSHALARAAHFAGIRLAKGSVCDTLEGDGPEGEEADGA